MCMFDARRDATGDEPVARRLDEGSCSLACCLPVWSHLVVALCAETSDRGPFAQQRRKDDRRECCETIGQQAAATSICGGGETMEFDRIVSTEVRGSKIGDRLKHKALSCRGGQSSSEKRKNQARWIPAVGGAPGPWGRMDVLPSWRAIPSPDADGLRLEVYNTPCMAPGVRSLVGAVSRAAENGMEPMPCAEGLGGTYMIQNDAGKKVAIFKPCDEEPMAPNNPKGFIGRSLGAPGLKTTVRVGEAAIREVAAYLLDHDRFAGVPHTVLVRASHPCFHYSSMPCAPETDELDLLRSLSLDMDTCDGGECLPLKVGSLQEFVSNICDTSDMGTSRFGARNIHRIGIFDIRVYNTDRHAGNILVCKPSGSGGCKTGAARLNVGQLELVPIDHGYCLPEALEAPYFEWLYWPQAMLPFGEEELKYIADLDVEADKDLLRSRLPVLSEESLRTLEVSTVLLKKCAAAGLSLHEVGQVMSRPLVGMDEELSELEKLCIAARQEWEEIAWSYKHDESISDWDGSDSSCMNSPTGCKEEELQFYITGVQGKQPTEVVTVPSAQCLYSSNSLPSCEMLKGLLPFDAEPQGDVPMPPSSGAEQQDTANDGPSNLDPMPIAFACHKPSRSVSVQIPAIDLPDRRRTAGPLGPVRQRKLSMQISCPNPSRPSYPRVRGGCASSIKDIFSDMSECEWRLFAHIFGERIDDALASCRWKLQDGIRSRGPASSAAGTSCPRFW